MGTAFWLYIYKKKEKYIYIENNLFNKVKVGENF